MDRGESGTGENATSSCVLGDYFAVARLVETYRRLGKLPYAFEYLTGMVQVSPSAKSDPGYNYVLGLYYW